MNMGEKLYSLRIEKKLTQKQLAARIGLAISAVSSYESGSRYPSFETLIKLARIFHVSTDYLLGLTERRSIDVTGLTDEEIELVSQLVDKLRKIKYFTKLTNGLRRYLVNTLIGYLENISYTE